MQDGPLVNRYSIQPTDGTEIPEGIQYFIMKTNNPDERTSRALALLGDHTSPFIVTHKNGIPVNPEDTYTVINLTLPTIAELVCMAEYVIACNETGYPDLGLSIDEVLKESEKHFGDNLIILLFDFHVALLNKDRSSS